MAWRLRGSSNRSPERREFGVGDIRREASSSGGGYARFGAAKQRSGLMKAANGVGGAGPFERSSSNNSPAVVFPWL